MQVVKNGQYLPLDRLKPRSPARDIQVFLPII
jgi:hypothetical protein